MVLVVLMTRRTRTRKSVLRPLVRGVERRQEVGIQSVTWGHLLIGGTGSRLTCYSYQESGPKSLCFKFNHASSNVCYLSFFHNCTLCIFHFTLYIFHQTISLLIFAFFFSFLFDSALFLDRHLMLFLFFNAFLIHTGRPEVLLIELLISG